MERGTKITVKTKDGIGLGAIHTPGTNGGAHFAQVKIGERTVNVYLKPAEEGETWTKGHDDAHKANT